MGTKPKTPEVRDDCNTATPPSIPFAIPWCQILQLLSFPLPLLIPAPFPLSVIVNYSQCCMQAESSFTFQPPRFGGCTCIPGCTCQELFSYLTIKLTIKDFKVLLIQTVHCLYIQTEVLVKLMLYRAICNDNFLRYHSLICNTCYRSRLFSQRSVENQHVTQVDF